MYNYNMNYIRLTNQIVNTHEHFKSLTNDNCSIPEEDIVKSGNHIEDVLIVGDIITISYRYDRNDGQTFNIKDEQHLRYLQQDILNEDIYLEAIYTKYGLPMWTSEKGCLCLQN